MSEKTKKAAATRRKNLKQKTKDAAKLALARKQLATEKAKGKAFREGVEYAQTIQRGNN